jgi:hypothetical protein
MVPLEGPRTSFWRGALGGRPAHGVRRALTILSVLGLAVPVAVAVTVIASGAAGASLSAASTYTIAGPTEVPGTTSLGNVACPTASSCVAVGTDDKSVVTITNGLPEAAQTISGIPAGSSLELRGVACTSATACVAVGIYIDVQGDIQSAVVPISDGTPGAIETLPGTGELLAVACPTAAATCTAVGYADTASHIDSLVVTIAAGVPGAVSLAADGGELVGVACSTATSCEAVGGFGVGSAGEAAVIPISNGVPGVPRPIPGSDHLMMDSVACPSATTCVAVGTSSASTYQQGVVVTVTDGTPSAAVPVPGNAALTFLTNGDDLACPSVTNCVAVGRRDMPTFGEPVLVPIRDGTPAAPEGFPGTTAVNSVACPTDTACQAVGGDNGDGPRQGVVYTLTKAGGVPPPVVNSGADGAAIHDGADGCDTGKTVVVDRKSVPECTLRAAIEAENAGSVTDKTITFAGLTPNTGRILIGVSSALPAVTRTGTTIDFSSAGAPVLLSPAYDPGTSAGIDVKAANVTVSGLYAVNFYSGVRLEAPGHDTVTGSYLGVSPVSPGNHLTVGVEVRSSADNQIGDGTPAHANVLSRDKIGVYIDGVASTGNRVQGNVIGASADGLSTQPDDDGVLVRDGSNNIVGGSTSSPGTGLGNLMQARSDSMIVVGIAAKATGNVVEGNTMGLDRTGGASFAGSCQAEVHVIGATQDTRIQANVISGRCESQIAVASTVTTGTLILANKLGTDLNGTSQVDVGTGSIGIRAEGASHTTIGQPGEGNLVVGFNIGIISRPRSGKTELNFPKPIPVPGSDAVLKGATSTIIAGNTVGALADGHTMQQTSSTAGVLAAGGGDLIRGNVIGGAKIGVLLADSTGTETVDGNKLGVDSSGLRALDNIIDVAVTTSKHAVIGSTTRPNVVYGHGIGIDVESSPKTVVRGNDIGVTPTGDAPVGPYAGTLPDGYAAAYASLAAKDGVAIDKASTGVQVEANVIGGLPGTGISVALATGTELSGNHVGVGRNRTADVGNAGDGIDLLAGTAPVVGATFANSTGTAVSGAGNVVAHNAGIGIHIVAVTRPRLLSNSVYSNGAGDLVTTAPDPFVPRAPELVLARNSAGHTIVTLSVDQDSSGMVQLFTASSCGVGRAGRSLLTSQRLVVVPGTQTGSVDIPLATLPVGTQIIATVTDPAKGTSAPTGCAEVRATAGASMVTSPSLLPGQSETVQGDGFAPDEQVQATLYSTPIDLGIHTADAHGIVRFSFLVPQHLPVGEHHIVLLGLTSHRADITQFTVSPTSTPDAATANGTSNTSSPAPTTTAPAVTGEPDNPNLLWTGLLALIAGAALCLTGRSRRAQRRPGQLLNQRAR